MTTSPKAPTAEERAELRRLLDDADAREGNRWPEDARLRAVMRGALLALDAAERERDEAQRHRAETNEQIKALHVVIKRKGFSVEDSVALNDFRDAYVEATKRIAALEAELAAAEKEAEDNAELEADLARKAEAIRMADVVASFVAGYALAELHRLGMQAMPAKIMEHARAALAELS